jgi:hypothetical protein
VHLEDEAVGNVTLGVPGAYSAKYDVSPWRASSNVPVPLPYRCMGMGLSSGDSRKTRRWCTFGVEPGRTWMASTQRSSPRSTSTER